jgi:nitrite reductase/ring-hydroxylating ferredoxin subunit
MSFAILLKKIKLLCEELVVFRDKKGRVGALDPHCSHRGTSLEWGRVEEEGLRCCYHGWLYDTQGQCIDMPCETEEFRERVDVWHPAYPAMEYGGLVFVYMGPPGTEPLFPMYDIIDTRYRKDVVLRGMRLWGEYSVGFVKDCNWLQQSVASADAAPDDQRRPVRGSVDAGCSPDRFREHPARRSIPRGQGFAKRQSLRAPRGMCRAERFSDPQYPRDRHEAVEWPGNLHQLRPLRPQKPVRSCRTREKICAAPISGSWLSPARRPDNKDWPRIVHC